MKKNISDFFTNEEKENIKSAVEHAELDTSGEIRVHIENVCKGDVLDRAAHLFNKLGMTKTSKRNGVLIYLALVDKKFAIIGDIGINKVVPKDFWDSIKDEMISFFKQDKFAEGLIRGISESSSHLKTYFPHKSDDVNELSDDISFNNN